MSFGIDYGMGETNIDKETGIRFGIISQNAIMPELLLDFEPLWGTASCPVCGEDVEESAEVEMSDERFLQLEEEDRSPDRDYWCDACEKSYWTENCYGDSPNGMRYEQDGYLVVIDETGDMWVMKSPYYTYAKFCSPCAPGAGHLSTPCEKEEGAPRVYCLDGDWFDEGMAPYKVYKV